MKIVKFNQDKKTNEVDIKLRLTDNEFKNFNVGLFADPERAKSILKSAVDKEDVIEAVFRAHDYPMTMREYVINSKESGRVKKVMEVRRTMIYYLRLYTHMTVTEIANLFNLTHAMTIYHYGKYKDFLEVKDYDTTRIDAEVTHLLNNT